MPKNYQHVLALVFAVKEINENPAILPNVSLGFHICDYYYNAKITYQNTLNLLFTRKTITPNYKCDVQKNLITVIGGLESETSLHMSNILSIYKVPQVGCVGVISRFHKCGLPIFHPPVCCFGAEKKIYDLIGTK